MHPLLLLQLCLSLSFLSEHQTLEELVKTTWPICRENHMTGEECQAFIDEEIITLFEGEDRNMRTHIVKKRVEADEWYNCLVIPMDDNDIVIGKFGDGLVYYDL